MDVLAWSNPCPDFATISHATLLEDLILLVSTSCPLLRSVHMCLDGYGVLQGAIEPAETRSAKREWSSTGGTLYWSETSANGDALREDGVESEA